MKRSELDQSVREAHARIGALQTTVAELARRVDGLEVTVGRLERGSELTRHVCGQHLGQDVNGVSMDCNQPASHTGRHRMTINGHTPFVIEWGELT